MTAFDLVFVDVETGGLDPSTADILEVACIRTDASGQLLLAAYETKVLPQSPVDARAAAVNGYTPEAWSEAILPVDAAGALTRAVIDGFERRAILCGHNVAFDDGFLRRMFDRALLSYPFDYHRIDTVSLAWPFYVQGKIDRLNLEAVCRHFLIGNEGAHRAMADAARCREVYLRMMEALRGGVVCSYP